MRFLVVLLAVFGTVFCQRGQYKPVQPGQPIAILRQASDVNPDGSYQWSYETENGISAEEQGTLKNVQSQEPVLAAQGGFRFTSPEGTPIEITYTADENGFQPQGNAIPQPPPIPDYILRAIAYNEAHPEQDDQNQKYRRP